MAADSPDTDAVATRRRALTIGVTTFVAVAVVIGGGWAVATTFESPAQREAAASAPTPGPVTAQVKRGDLARTISFPGTAETADQKAYAIPSQNGDRAVVTRSTLESGATINPGDVVTEVNGRPIFATAGQFAFYRDLATGDHGTDVEQLQNSLIAMGLLSSADGNFGAATERAVRSLYQRAGYAVPETRESSAEDTPPTDIAPGDGGATSDGSGSRESAGSSQAQAQPVLQIPAGEFIVLGNLPSRLAAAPSIGDALDGDSKVTIERGQLQVTSAVPALSAAALGVGQKGTFTPTEGESVEIQLQSVGTGTEDGADVPVLSTGVKALPPDLRGKSGVITVTLDIVAKNSLLVPTIAVSAGGRGEAHLLVQRGNHFERIAVRELGQLEGTSAVEILDDVALEPGDQVRVS